MPLRVCCDGRPRKGPRLSLPFAFGHAVRNEIHIKQNRSDRCNAGPRFAPCPGLPGVLDLSCLPPFRLLPGSPARALLPDAIASSRHMHDTLSSTPLRVCACGCVCVCLVVCLPSRERHLPPPIPASSSFFGIHGDHHWSPLAPRPDQSCRIVSGPGHAERRS